MSESLLSHCQHVICHRRQEGPLHFGDKMTLSSLSEKLTPCCAQGIHTCMLAGCAASCCRGARMPLDPHSRTAARWIVKSTNTHCTAAAPGLAANSPSSLVTRAWAKAFSDGWFKNLEVWMYVFKVSNSCRLKRALWINVYKLNRHQFKEVLLCKYTSGLGWKRVLASL